MPTLKTLSTHSEAELLAVVQQDDIFGPGKFESHHMLFTKLRNLQQISRNDAKKDAKKLRNKFCIVCSATRRKFV